MPRNHKKSEGDNNNIRNWEMTPLSSVFDKSKATSINLSCHNNLPTTEKCSSDNVTTKTSPPPTKRSKNDKPKNDIETIHDAFDPGDEVLDEGESKKQQHEYIIDDQMQLGYPPTELPTDKPTRPSANGTGFDPQHSNSRGNPCWAKTEPNIERKTKTNNK